MAEPIGEIDPETQLVDKMRQVVIPDLVRDGAFIYFRGGAEMYVIGPDIESSAFPDRHTRPLLAKIMVTPVQGMVIFPDDFTLTLIPEPSSDLKPFSLQFTPIFGKPNVEVLEGNVSEITPELEDIFGEKAHVGPRESMPYRIGSTRSIDAPPVHDHRW